MVSAALLPVSSIESEPVGRHSLQFEFKPTGLVGRQDATVRSPTGWAAAWCAAFTGSLAEVTMDASGEQLRDGEAEMRLILGQQ